MAHAKCNMQHAKTLSLSNININLNPTPGCWLLVAGNVNLMVMLMVDDNVKVTKIRIQRGGW
jgi:hypothetical protein